MRLVIRSKYQLPLIYIIASPIADFLTGIMIHKMHMSEGFLGSPSQILRIIFLFFFFLIINKKQLRISTLVLFWLIGIESTCLFFAPSIVCMVSGLNNAIKILFILVLYFACKTSLSKDLRYIDFAEALLNSAMLYRLGILVPTVFGIGMTTYTEGTFGQRGLFASGNALGIYLGITGIFSILFNRNTTYCHIRTFIIIGSLAILGTKTSLVCLVACLLIVVLKQRRSIKILLFTASFILVYLYHNEITDLFNKVFDVIVFLFNRKSSFFEFVMNSRDDYIINAFSQFFESNIWGIKLIFGGGAFMSFRPIFTNGMVFDQLEMDVFDILFMWGIIGLTIYLSVIFYFFILAIKVKNSYLIIISIFFSLHSILAGHILFDGIPMIVGIFTALSISNYRQFELYFSKGYERDICISYAK